MKEVATEALTAAGGTWAEVTSVGVAVPTSVDPATGDALHAPALGWKNQPARKTFEKVFDRPIYLENDGNCGTLAEYKGGAARGARSVVAYFVGTGLGGGIIIDGKLRRGVRGVAGELGHEIVRHNGRPCGCGHRGCIEAYCSKTAFCRQFDRLINGRGQKSCLTDMVGSDFSSIRSKALRKAYEREDAVVRAVLDKGAEMLGVAAANLMAVLSPDCIVLGGGVMEALGEELLPRVRDSLDRHLFGIRPEDAVLKLSEYRDDAVPMGAAFLARGEGKV
jgi:glucokinase